MPTQLILHFGTMPLSKREAEEVIPDMEYLVHCSGHKRSKIIASASPTLLRALSECARNFIQGNVQTDKFRRCRLRKFMPQ